MNPILVFVLLISLIQARPTDAQIQGRLNIVNGYAAECVMHKFYSNSAWTQIEGEVGRNGIDGLYYKKKNGTIREVLVAESKWNKSRLGKSGKHKLIKQMSKEWVLRTLQRLEKYRPVPEYGTIKKMVINDQYRARLFRMFPRGKDKVQIQVYRIKNKGDRHFDLKINTKIPAISMEQPKNRFERGILNAYNQCRAEALHKYFPELKRNEIFLLLKDNYLQKNDLKKMLNNQ